MKICVPFMAYSHRENRSEKRKMIGKIFAKMQNEKNEFVNVPHCSFSYSFQQFLTNLMDNIPFAIVFLYESNPTNSLYIFEKFCS